MGKSPYKMKGHSLPGPNQKKSPMKMEPVTLSMLIGAGISAATAGAKGLATKAAKKKAVEKTKRDEALELANSGIDALSDKDMGSKTKLTD
jgi:hypothetical protein